MTILLDDKGHLASTDGLEELHQFARSIGLKKEWFQNKVIPHYDLKGNKPKDAINKGAVRVTSRELIRRYWEMRRRNA